MDDDVFDEGAEFLFWIRVVELRHFAEGNFSGFTNDCEARDQTVNEECVVFTKVWSDAFVKVLVTIVSLANIVDQEL